jgi:hypothetical protein
MILVIETDITDKDFCHKNIAFISIIMLPSKHGF